MAVGDERLLWLLLGLALLLLWLLLLLVLLLVVAEALVLAALLVPFLVLVRWRYPISATHSNTASEFCEVTRWPIVDELGLS